MINEPHIPMSPEELPQQRIHEVIDLPPKPEPFSCHIGYSQLPKGSLPASIPQNMTYLAQVEWAWSPMNNRLDAYYLHRGRTHWSLWTRYWDDNWGQWSDVALGCIQRKGITEEQAAVYLLLEFWKAEVTGSSLDEYHWINEEQYLSVAQLAAIAREVW